MNLLAHWLATTDEVRAAVAPNTCRIADGLLLAEQDRLRRLVHRLLGWSASAAQVDDLVQDTLLAALRKRGSFRGDASVATWLQTIAVRTVHNHVRWRRVRRLLVPWSGDEAHLPAVDGACPVERRDDIQAMRGAMARLRHGDREVLVLHYLEVRPVADVARLLGIGRAAVEQRLSRARARLRSLLPGGDGRSL